MKSKRRRKFAYKLHFGAMPAWEFSKFSRRRADQLPARRRAIEIEERRRQLREVIFEAFLVFADDDERVVTSIGALAIFFSLNVSEVEREIAALLGEGRLVLAPDAGDDRRWARRVYKIVVGGGTC